MQSAPPSNPNRAPGPPARPTSQVAADAALLEAALFEMKKIIVGQERVIERLFVCLLARGHCLLEGVPGLAKTLAMETLARTMGGTFNRLQFTPDLLPADIVGTRIYRHSSETFDVELGPIFANFILADEVNRAPAKVQSALLEVMAEHHVSIAGHTYEVPEPFLVLATQNPIESEGVYALPEAQRDRFLMKVLVGYPSPQEEVEIVQRMGAHPPVPRSVLTTSDLARLQQAATDVYVDRSVVDYAVNLVLATRSPGDYGMVELTPLIEYGASPRASLGLVAAGRALALLRGRRYVLPQDVFDVAPEILRHRLVLSYEALAQGLVTDQISARVLSTVPAPRVTPILEGADPGVDSQAPAPLAFPSPASPSAPPGGPPPLAFPPPGSPAVSPGGPPPVAPAGPPPAPGHPHPTGPVGVPGPPHAPGSAPGFGPSGTGPAPQPPPGTPPPPARSPDGHGTPPAGAPGSWAAGDAVDG